MLEHQGVESDFGAENRDDLHLSQQAVEVGVRNLCWALVSMNGEIADLNAETERRGVKATQINAASGDAFDFVDYAAANPGLKGIGSRIPSEACKGESTDTEK